MDNQQSELISTLHGRKEMYTRDDMISFAKDVHRYARMPSNYFNGDHLSDQSAHAIMSEWIKNNSIRVIWKGEELQVGNDFEVSEDKIVTVRIKLP